MEESSSFDINARDIRSVRIYRGGIVLSALAFVLGSGLVIATEAWNHPSSADWIGQHRLLLTFAVVMLAAGTGTAVINIHLYIRQFHAVLKLLFAIGLVSTLLLFIIGFFNGHGFLTTLYQKPYGILGFGFILASLCGIAVKEAFCFGQLEAILFAVVTPTLVLGHLFHAISPMTATFLLCLDTLLLCIFAIRKEIMPASLDIGDKSVYMQETRP